MLPVETTMPILQHTPELATRWTKERATEWSEENGWMIGCNYIPSNAMNQLEMWQEESFSPFLIDKELSWAASLGFNTIRVFLHDLLWQQDAEGFLKRVDWFLAIANKHGIKTILVLFDAVWDPFPKSGKQCKLRLNVHNSGWVQSPGFKILNDPSKYDSLQDYVQGIVCRFSDDKRVLIWDVFNEPDNMNMSSYKDNNYIIHKADLSLKLLRKAIRWIRVINPVQPLTSAPWQWIDTSMLSTIDHFMFTHMDIISFHCYEHKKGLEKRIIELKQFDRPMLCTEYMARQLGSTFEEILPVLKKYKVGGYNWGLVAGKTQTNLPWDSWTSAMKYKPNLWFHDIFYDNGKPYNQKEVEFIRSITQKEVNYNVKQLEIA
jgi:hypothetical protein